MGWLALLAGVVGFVAVYYANVTVPADYGAYLSIAALAGLDSVIGGARAAQAGTFKQRIFISGFLTAVLVAVILTWFGERLGVQIFLAVGFVFVYRIMQNLSIIRWYILDDENPHLQWIPGWRKNNLVPAKSELAESSNSDIPGGSGSL